MNNLIIMIISSIILFGILCYYIEKHSRNYVNNKEKEENIKELINDLEKKEIEEINKKIEKLGMIKKKNDRIWMDYWEYPNGEFYGYINKYYKGAKKDYEELSVILKFNKNKKKT